MCRDKKEEARCTGRSRPSETVDDRESQVGPCPKDPTGLSFPLCVTRVVQASEVNLLRESESGCRGTGFVQRTGVDGSLPRPS